MSNGQLLDMEDRVDWKTCQVSKVRKDGPQKVFILTLINIWFQEEETEMTKEFRKMFSPFDFTME